VLELQNLSLALAIVIWAILRDQTQSSQVVTKRWHTHTAAITAVIFQLVHIIAGAAAHDKSSIARTRTALGRRPCPALPRPTQPTTGRRPLQMLDVFTSVGGPSSRPNVLKMQIRAPFSRYPRARPAPLFGFVRPPG
jgi:hypothetical protein